MKKKLSTLLMVTPLFAGHALADTANLPQVSHQVIEASVSSEKADYQITQILSGLTNPWAIDWLPDGRMLVTERLGNLYIVDGDKITQVKGLPKIHSDEDQKTAPMGGSQSGLLDVAVHPDYADNGWIYLTYSSPGDADGLETSDVGTATAVARGKLSADATQLQELETIYAQSPRRIPGRHYGSRIVFDDNETILFSIGDRGLRAPSQDLTDPAGSIIRIMEYGGAYEDNPFVGVAPGNLRPEIYSYGHRNNQAMALHPETGELWTAEHGPNGGDLLHRVLPGENYGWPHVAFAPDYTTSEMIGIGDAAPGVIAPVYGWRDSMAPSGMLFYQGEAFPEWQGSLFIGSLKQSQLHRIELHNNEVEHEEILIKDRVGRIRDVQQGPDGFLYVVTDESNAKGGVYQIAPK